MLIQISAATKAATTLPVREVLASRIGTEAALAASAGTIPPASPRAVGRRKLLRRSRRYKRHAAIATMRISRINRSDLPT